MQEYRIWGRIERLPGESFRAIAAAAPDGAGPDPEDMLTETLPTRQESQVALGRMLYQLTSTINKRGDQVGWLDVR